MVVPSPAISDETEPVVVPAITYSSWADEVEAADSETKDKPVEDESADESTYEGPAENPPSEEPAEGEEEMLESDAQVYPQLTFNFYPFHVW